MFGTDAVGNMLTGYTASKVGEDIAKNMLDNNKELKKQLKKEKAVDEYIKGMGGIIGMLIKPMFASKENPLLKDEEN